MTQPSLVMRERILRKDVFSKSFHALFVRIIILFNCGMCVLVEDSKSVAFEDFACHGELIILIDDEFLKILLSKDVLLNTSGAK